MNIYQKMYAIYQVIIIMLACLLTPFIPIVVIINLVTYYGFDMVTSDVPYCVLYIEGCVGLWLVVVATAFWKI